MIGRPPTTRIAILAALAEHKDGIDQRRMVAITGLTESSVRDMLFKLRKSGEAHWLSRGRLVLHFGSAEDCAAYALDHPTFAQRQAVRTYMGRSARVPEVAAALSAAPAIGMSVTEVSKAVSVTTGNASRLLGAMERSGEAWRHGPAHFLRWYPSQAAKEVGAKLVDAHIAAKRASMAAGKKRGGEVVAAQGASTKWTKMPVAASVREIPQAMRGGGQRAAKVQAGPPEVVWPASVTVQRLEMPPSRYAPDPGHVGDFSRLGPGRYCD